MGEHIPVVDPTERESTEPVARLTVRAPFRKGGCRLDLLRTAAGDRSGWHRREGAVFGWVHAGRGRLEYGPREEHTVGLEAGEFLRVPAASTVGTSPGRCR